VTNYLQTKLAASRQLLRLHPHWLLFAISLLCWANILLESQDRHHHHHHHMTMSALSDAMSQLLGWLTMVYAMMLPMLSGSLRWLLQSQPRYLRWRGIIAFLLGYSCLWLAIGLAIYGLGLWLNGLPQHSLQQAQIGALAFFSAGLISRTSYRQSAVYACGSGMPLRIQGWGAWFDTFQFGAIKGGRCAASCLHLMVALILAGHTLPLMLLVTALLFYERRLLPRRTRMIEIACYSLALLYTLLWLQPTLFQ
jgi:hypothetical protein